MKKTMAVMALAALGLVACGGSDKSSSDSDEAAATESTDTSASDDTAATDNTTASDDTAAADDSDADTDTGVGKGDPNSSFCKLAREIEDESNLDKVFENATTPEDMKKALGKAVDAIDELVSKAPSELKSDAKTLKDGIHQMSDLFDKHDYDFAKIAQDPEFTDLGSSDKFETASDHFDDFLQETCGIDTTGS